MLNEIVAWWLRQMVGLLPARLRVREVGPANAIVLWWHEAVGGAELLLRRDHKEVSLGEFALDEAGLRVADAMLGNNRRGLATVLRLPGGILLERQVTLPLAAEQGLDRVVRFEMDRFTPFSAEEVFFACAVRRRDRAQGKLVAAISLVPRARLAQPLHALDRLNLTPGLLEAPDERGGMAGETHRIPLGAGDRTGAIWQRRGLVAAAAGCAALAVIAVVLPFWLQADASRAAEDRIAELRAPVRQAEALRAKLTATAEGGDVIGAERARVGDALHTLAILTDNLPDDTHLIGLAMQRRLVTLEGQSAAAARLLTTLAADPAVRNAAFAAPVTRAPNGADLFSIKAEIAP